MDYQRKYLKYKAKYIAYKQALELEYGAMQSGGGINAVGTVRLYVAEPGYLYGFYYQPKSAKDKSTFEEVVDEMKQYEANNSKWFLCEKKITQKDGGYDLSGSGFYYEFNKENYEAMNDDRSPLYIASLEFIQKYDEKDFESKKRVDHPKVEQAKEEKQKQEEIAQAAIREKNEQIAAQKISVPQVRPSTKEESMGIARKVDNLIRIIVEARKDINKTAFEKFSYVFEKIKKAQENPVTRYLNDDRWKSFVSFWNEKTSEISDADRPHINAEQKKQLGMSIRYFFHLLAGEDPFEEYSQYNKEFLEALRWLEM